MSASADVTKILSRIGYVAEQARRAAILACDMGGEQVIGDAQQLCPVRTGALQASGTT